MSQTIKVTEVTENKSAEGKTYFIITDSDGAKFGYWGKPPGGLVNGSTIEAEVVVKGKYNNIKDGSIKVLTVTEKPAPVAETAKPVGEKYRYWGKSPEELELSRRSFALSYAKDLALADKIKVTQVIIWATDFDNWLQGNPVPEDAGVSLIPAEPSLVKEALEIWAEPTKITKEQLAQIQKIVTDKKIDKMQFNACALETIGKEVDKLSVLSYDEAEKLIPSLSKWVTKG